MYVRKAQLIIVLAVVTLTAFTCYGAGSGAPDVIVNDAKTGQLTVWATVRFDQATLDKTDQFQLAAVATHDTPTPPALAVQLVKVTRGWFGSFWTLQLVGNTDILPEPITLLDSPSVRWTGTFNVSVAYDAQTGAAIVSYETEEGESLVSTRLQLQPSAASLQAYISRELPLEHDETEEINAPHIVASGHYPGFIPLNVPWHITQQPASSGGEAPTTHLHRGQPAWLRVDMPADALPGNMELHLMATPTEQGNANAAVARWPITSGETTALAIAPLPAGTYRAELQYTVDDRTFILGQKNIVIGMAAVQLRDMKTSREDNSFHVRGTLVIDSDGPLPATHVAVTADLLGHPPAYVAGGTALGNTRPTVVATDVPIVAQTVHPAGERIAVTFEKDIALPAQPYRFWETVLNASTEPGTYVIGLSSVSAWIGPEPGPHDWQGYLSNEITTHTAVAPGIDVYTIRGQIEAGPIQMYLVRADLTNPHVTVDTIIPRYPTWTSPLWPRMAVSEMTRQAGAAAGINASFFEISTTMMPRGTAIRSGRLLTSAIPGWDNVIAFTADGSPSIGRWQWQGGVRRPDGSAFRSAHGFNVLHKFNNQLTIYASPPPMKSPGTDSGLEHVVELVVGNLTEVNAVFAAADERILRGQVQQIRQKRPGMALTEDVMVVTGYGTAADYLLQTYALGDEIDLVLTFATQGTWPHIEDWRTVHAAVPTGVILVQNGTYGDTGVRSDPERHPRTAVGFTWDQSVMYWLVVDGRSGTSVGMTYKELADFFLHVGAFHAVNFDGGGSSALAIADPNTGRVRAINRPSDGGERLVPDGIGLFYTPVGMSE